MMEDNKGKNFIKGAVILSAAGLLAKIMGFVYRIILTRIIGAQGIAIYQLAYPIYTTLLVVSRSGIPISLAKLISDRIAKGERRAAFKIFKVGRYLSVIVGLFFSLLMFFSAGPLINLLNWDPRAYYAVLALSPAIFFVSIMATYRGFFQGLQTMIPTAYSQIIEQWVRMLTMIGLVYFLVPYGLGYAAAGATFGAVSGSIAGLFTLLFIYYRKRKDIWNFVNNESSNDIDTFSIIKEISSLGIPIIFGALVQPMMNLVDAVIVPQRLLLAGYSVEEALDLFGHLSGIAMVLVNFPTIMTVSLAASLVPSISEAFALKRDDLIKKRTQSGLRLSLLLGFPSSVGLFVLARPLTSVIFDVPEAAEPLFIVAWSVIFITIYETSSAVLHGIGKTSVPARNLFIGAITNGIINYFLTAMPYFGIKGAALGTSVGFALAAIFNLISVIKYTHFNFNIKDLILKPSIAVFLMALLINWGFVPLEKIVSYFLPYYSYTISTFMIVFIAIIFYVFLLLLIREIRYSDLILIPKIGKKIAEKLKKYGLVRD
jgi:stage V sporulation protein B